MLARGLLKTAHEAVAIVGARDTFARILERLEVSSNPRASPGRGLPSQADGLSRMFWPSSTDPGSSVRLREAAPHAPGSRTRPKPSAANLAWETREIYAPLA